MSGSQEAVAMKEEMSREVLFAQSLERVRRTAREQGNSIRGEQVREEFSGLELKEEQLQMVFDYLEKHGVGVDGPGSVQEDALSEQERDYLQDYLDEIARLPVYSEEELAAYSRLAVAGDAKAQKCLAESFLSEVVDIAKLYTGQGVYLEDLIGEGNVALAVGTGMLEGMEGGPAEVRGKLAGMVMDAMEELIRENTANERTDQTVAERVNLVADRARDMAEELRRKVTPRELAQETGLSLGAIQDALRMSGFKIEDIEYAEDSI